MPYFRIEARGATLTIVEAPDWEVAIARYARLREFTGWSGDTPLTVSETVAMPAKPNAPALVFTEDLFRIAMNMRSAGAQLAGRLLGLPTSYSDSRLQMVACEGSRERLIEALMEFSALKLRAAREPTAGLSTRVAAAFDAGYAALLAVACRHSLPDVEQHPSAKALKAAATAGGLEEHDVMLGLRLLRWVVAEQYVEPETLPVSLPAAIEWAERIRALLSN